MAVFSLSVSKALGHSKMQGSYEKTLAYMQNLGLKGD